MDLSRRVSRLQNMILLLVCSFDHCRRFEKHGRASRYGETRGEIETRALDFRTMVTTFYLALSACASLYIQDRCQQVFEVAVMVLSLWPSP
jgi:hypothetical protein